MTPNGSIKKFLVDSSDVVIVATEATRLVQELMDRIGAYPPAMVHLGQACIASLLLQALNDKEGNEKVELQWLCAGPFGNLYVESLGLGRVRGTLTNPKAEVESLKQGLGTGLFQVRRVVSEAQMPFTGIVSATGFVGQDVVEYLEKSEQKNCGVSLSVKIVWDESRKPTPFRVERAEGYLVHILPQEREERKNFLLQSWDKHMKDLGPLSEWELPQDPSENTSQIIHFLTGKPVLSYLWEHPLELYCTCSQERAERALSLLAEGERRELIGDTQKNLEMNCEYCGATYKLSFRGRG